MNEQLGWRAVLRNLQNEAPQWAALLPGLPRRLNNLVGRDPLPLLLQGYAGLLREQKKRNAWLGVIAGLLTVSVLVWLAPLFLPC